MSDGGSSKLAIFEHIFLPEINNIMHTVVNMKCHA